MPFVCLEQLYKYFQAELLRQRKFNLALGLYCDLCNYLTFTSFIKNVSPIKIVLNGNTLYSWLLYNVAVIA